MGWVGVAGGGTVQGKRLAFFRYHAAGPLDHETVSVRPRLLRHIVLSRVQANMAPHTSSTRLSKTRARQVEEGQTAAQSSEREARMNPDLTWLDRGGVRVT